MELWKDIIIANQNYRISSLGNLVRCKYTYILDNKLEEMPEQVIKKYKYGPYLYYNIGNKTIPIRKLVAEHFVPNPNCYNIVVSIDGDSTSCDASNLKWASRSETMKSYRNSEHYRRSSGRSKPVYCKETDRTYSSAKEAISDIADKLDVSLNYDRVLRHLTRSNCVCLDDIHLSKVENRYI